MIQFTVYGAPVAQPRQRHRVVAAAGRVFASNYTPAKAPVNQWKADVKTAALAALGPTVGPPWTCPLRLVVRLFLPRPASRMRQKDPEGPVPCPTKPDIDNAYKSIADALAGVIFADDKQVCEALVQKYYHEKARGPRAEIMIEMF